MTKPEIPTWAIDKAYEMANRIKREEGTKGVNFSAQTIETMAEMIAEWGGE